MKVRRFLSTCFNWLDRAFMVDLTPEKKKKAKAK